MSDIYTPMVRAVVVAALLLASATVMLVTMNTARAAGALAVGRCGAFGEAYDFPTAQAARNSAMSKCNDGCRLVADVKRSCAAFAVDFHNPCGANGWARAPRLGRAQNAALQSCYRDGGRECVIRAFLCDAKG